jgi:phosphoglycerate dehydrogenase-like enzyme
MEDIEETTEKKKKKKKNVILLALDPDTLPEEQLNQLRDGVPGNKDLIVTQDKDSIEAVIDEIEIAAGWFPRNLLPRASGLRWFQQWAAGADWLLRHPEALEMDFVLTNMSGIHPIPVTEHTFAFLLAFARELSPALQAQRHHEWIPPGQHRHLFELAEKTMLLIGVGAIGERTAQVAAAMNIRVLGIRRDPTVDTAGVEATYSPDQLHDLLPQADFVVLTVPLTEETRGMIGEQELRAMQPTSYLINVGRGGTVDEDALLRALRRGWIAGAGLDVFETEPLPEDSPLWELDNVIITSHYAGVTPHYHERALSVFHDNLERYHSGLPLQNVVNKTLGY